jgi:hypothetical protein
VPAQGLIGSPITPHEGRPGGESFRAVSFSSVRAREGDTLRRNISHHPQEIAVQSNFCLSIVMIRV